jgi:hypothetical protein
MLLVKRKDYLEIDSYKCCILSYRELLSSQIFTIIDTQQASQIITKCQDHKFHHFDFSQIIQDIKQKMNLKTPILLPLINDYFPKFIKIVIYEGASLIKFKYLYQINLEYFLLKVF